MTTTTIRLYGEMGQMFGRVHRVALDTCTPAEAIRYLCSQFPKARAYLTQSGDRGVGFAVFRGKENLDVDNLREPVGADDIRIAPMIMGSKNGGVFNIVLGAVLIAASFIPFLAPVAPYLLNAGIALVAGGVIQLLTPVPKGGKGQDRPENAPSYVFSGAVNTQAQGNPVPLLYGRMIVGSAVVSAGINAEDYAPASSGVDSGHAHFNPKNPYELPA